MSLAPTAEGRAAHADGRLKPDHSLVTASLPGAHAEGLQLVGLELPMQSCGQAFRNEEPERGNGAGPCIRVKLGRG
jgi:hypothetical protein